MDFLVNWNKPISSTNITKFVPWQFCSWKSVSSDNRSFNKVKWLLHLLLGKKSSRVKVLYSFPYDLTWSKQWSERSDVKKILKFFSFKWSADGWTTSNSWDLPFITFLLLVVHFTIDPKKQKVIIPQRRQLQLREYLEEYNCIPIH